ncbi:4-hydroxy-tetrahydrodipicolinate synthase [Paenibacillus psychroresistens]|uniref:4-hydroxy-tetrahydrodipicolinate synthase n=1 Tax=Paenibacillus psychroresistens TaxID=1778678 RepID=A0A6B8RHA2_9BACL|nr:4-hydroxy-tetrahydrodipicolinate synthase [Paenibacillus psychroresistens]QGQ94903.1 4-hydroxy-tetrahydrodipicolinate synthase [Paenibacillus psychroresistens]
MLTEPEIKGIWIPLITPLNLDDEVDHASFERFIQRLPLFDIQGLVLNGTTGESPTIAIHEIVNILETVRKSIGSAPLPLMIGTGTNDTAGTIRRTEQAGLLGADAALVVVPYYSRPSQAGIIEHYRKVAEVGVPIMVYDIPGRTGVSLTVDTLRTLFEIDGIVGLKDSTGSTEMTSKLVSYDAKPILCGEDILFLDALRSGASGGMAASANVLAKEFAGIYNLFKSGEHDAAKADFTELIPLINLLFKESNPAPLKWLLAQKGWISSDRLRLPMLGISEQLQQELSFYV